MFSGSIPALVTPFRDGAFDEAAFRRLVDWQIESGSSALVPCGTTGEASTLSNDEHHRVIAVCVEQAAGRVPVIAGCGSNDTMNAALHMREARAAGATAALVVAPYYNRPNQDGLIAHFGYLAENSELPIVLYNVPGRTVTDIKPATVIELTRRHPGRFVGMKDASGDLTRVIEHRMGIGAEGCISVTANVAPALCAEFQRACAAGDLAGARALDERLYPLHKAMFCDASPAPVKYALAATHDWFPDGLRLPMVAASAEARAQVDAALVHAGLVLAGLA